jgi:hypothetical protein
VLEADNVVNAPVPGVVAPIFIAFRFETVPPSETAVAPKVIALFASMALVTVAISAEPISVPAAGKVQVLVDGMANVGLKAPVKVVVPPSVSVFEPLLTPVPP